MPKHVQKPSIRRSHIALATLTATLAMGLSHRAMAASCETVNSGGVYFNCSGDDQEIPEGKDLTPTASQTIVKILGTENGGVADTELKNDKDLSAMNNAGTAGANTATLYGVTLSDDDGVDSFKFTNNGSIDLTHNGVGALAGIYAIGGAADDGFLVINNGSITVTRGPLTPVTNTIDVSVGGTQVFTAQPNPNPGSAPAATVNIAAAIRIDEEETFQARIENYGSITASGPASYGMFVRPTALEILNEGTISASGDFSAAIVSWDGRANTTDDGGTKFRTYGKTFLDNSGTISGDVYVIDASRETFARNGSTQTSDIGALDVVRTINSGQDPYTLLGAGRSPERRDSEINNFGTIDGNVYLFAGSHTVTNAATDAEITGNIVVDQRRTVLYSAGADQYGIASRFTSDEEDDDEDEALSANYYSSAAALVAANPDHHFTFENAGKMDGNVTVLTYDTTGGGTASTVLLKPHITGVGSQDPDAPSTNSGFIGGTLAIGTGAYVLGVPTVAAADSTVATTAKLTPVIDVTVRDGDAYLVANHLVGTQLPQLVEDSFLVDWTRYQVGGSADGNALAIRASVKNASSVEGISAAGAATLNALIAAAGEDDDLDALGAGVENLTTAEDVAKAGKQLSPETNFATQQAAITLNNAIGQHIDTRLNSVGATGVSQGYTNAPYGLGMKPQQTDPNRSNLGGSLKDDPEFIAPRSAALWGQAFGAGMNQNERQDVDGYDARIYGLMVGYDNWISPGVRVGVAGGYANTRIDGEGDTTQNHTDIDSYLIQAYGAVKGSGWYATGRTGFTWHDYDTQRAMTVPVDDVAKGSHNGDQLNASIEIGAPMAHSGTVITPVASLTYSRLHQDGYSETSDGAMALAVGSQNNDSFVSGLGVKALVPIASDTVIEGRALWLHEFADDAQVVNASFAAGGGTFTAAGPGVGRDSADLGIGMLAQIGFNSTFEINYDANVREDYLAHVGSARIDVHF